MTMPTPARLRELLHYNPETGDLTWRIGRGRASAGSRAGCMYVSQNNRKGFVYSVTVDGRTNITGARLIWCWMTGGWPKHEVDHRDGDRSNNRWSNLREATRHQNEANKGAYRNSKSGIKGVWFIREQGWRAVIMRHGVRQTLGHFSTKEEAGQAYRDASMRLDGEFSYARKLEGALPPFANTA